MKNSCIPSKMFGFSMGGVNVILCHHINPDTGKLHLDTENCSIIPMPQAHCSTALTAVSNEWLEKLMADVLGEPKSFTRQSEVSHAKDKDII